MQRGQGEANKRKRYAWRQPGKEIMTTMCDRGDSLITKTDTQI